MLELYHAERCPYCVKVRQFLEIEGIAYVSKPVPLGNAMTGLKQELLKVGGKVQLPFMVDGETAMYESDDIIAYIKQHYVQNNP